jgi:hypothetical protein
MALNLDQMMGNHLSTYYNPKLTLTHAQVKQGEQFTKIIKIEPHLLCVMANFANL